MKALSEGREVAPGPQWIRALTGWLATATDPEPQRRVRVVERQIGRSQRSQRLMQEMRFRDSLARAIRSAQRQKPADDWLAQGSGGQTSEV